MESDHLENKKIEMYLREIDCEDRTRTELTQDQFQWQALVSAVFKLLFILSDT
jgi:hypothetical protein